VPIKTVPRPGRRLSADRHGRLPRDTTSAISVILYSATFHGVSQFHRFNHPAQPHPHRLLYYRNHGDCCPGVNFG
jgi:hypothetical protein